jgi:hypothetical protein
MPSVSSHSCHINTHIGQWQHLSLMCDILFMQGIWSIYVTCRYDGLQHSARITSNYPHCPFVSSFQVRPCEMYKEEYSECTSVKARFHQYFIFGKSVDCSQWKRDFENCVRWRDNHNSNALVKIKKKSQFICIRYQLCSAVRIGAYTWTAYTA